MIKQTGFSNYELHERVLSAVKSLGFRAPTEVQHKVIPLFTQKRNLIVEAPTGTGKTAAYGLPLISRINLQKRSTQALVLAPSRELALQISASLTSFFDGDTLKVGTVFGGVPMEESFAVIRSAPHILVVVPGRLKDLMAHFQYDYLWRDIRFLIVDEGDKLVESGFLRDFDEIREHVRNQAQIGVFSATISRDAEQMLRERFSPIETVRLSPRSVLKNIRFSVAEIRQGQREIWLAGLLQQEGITKALIFCGKRQELYAVTGFLRNAGFKAEAYYGNQEQTERANILQRFKEGHINYLVASDLAARGLDIEDLPAVINLSIPKEYDFYLHRVGRTGRAGNKGEVFNLVRGEAEKVRLDNHHRVIGLALKPISIRTPEKPSTPLDQRWIKVHISRGKRDKLMKGDIVGFMVNEASLTSEEIGTITIYDAYAIVDIPQQGFQTLRDQGDGLKIKGKSVKVRRFQQEEQERKDKSVEKLKKDRRK
ncbi:MAG: DEAD/DEAH box helicase [Bacteroidia bacterium]